MRAWILTASLVLAGSTAAQTPPQTPDAATCARKIVPTKPLTPELQSALQATLDAYQGNIIHLTRQLNARPPTPQERQVLKAKQQELETYVTRILGTIGWPSDPRLQAALEGLINGTPGLWCAGQAALKTGTAPDTAARLIDRALLNMTGKQRYGTVLFTTGRRLKPAELEDPARVDVRRAAIGLSPLAQSISEAEAALPPRAVPPGLARPVVLREVCTPYTTEQALNTPLTAERIDTLIDEAAAWVEQDQASRTGRPGARDMTAVDADTTAWLKKVLRESGWPSANRSDPDLASNAWLLAQHADRAPMVQECVLDLISQQRSTLREAQNYAYLTDRVRIGSGQPQVYGTQVQYDDVQGKASPLRLEDPARVDQRRAAVGLGSLAEYLKGFEKPR